MRVKICALILLSSGPALAAGSGPTYTVLPLQPANPGDAVVPLGISTAGPVGFSDNVNAGFGVAAVEPVVWEGGQAGLLPLPDAYYGQARGASGAYAVGSIWPVAANPVNPGLGGYVEPALWSGGQPLVLSTLGEPSGEALAVNAGGTAVGFLNSEGDPSDEFQAVVWSQGQATVIASFPSAQAQGVAINGPGQVVVQVGSTQALSALLWSNGTLSAIPSNGYKDLVANAINDSGEVVGGIAADNGTGVAFLYHNTITAPLASLPGDTYENALAINNIGEAVGIGTDATGTSRALLWQDGNVIDLNTLLPTNSGWFLSEATAISDDGTIVGEGAYNGQEMGFELTPTAIPSGAVPEPASLGALALGALALLRRRGRGGNR